MPLTSAEGFHGGPQLSRQYQIPHGKSKRLTAITKSSRQKQKLTAKPNGSRQNQKAHGKTKQLTAKTKSSRQNRLDRGSVNRICQPRSQGLSLHEVANLRDRYCERNSWTDNATPRHRPRTKFLREPRKKR